ncbi:hypothetical protein HanRHA438_Chr04g0166961 [Helianthus annuus]|nr:hypothetical protein HanIR_Chr04g0168851 [Helianthus annuus]KAJ0926082.1 hypothetical protein HanRHA438_Chr04g0166961 [Helianthus annuus]
MRSSSDPSQVLFEDFSVCSSLTDLQLKLKKEALQLERSVNWNSTVSQVNQNIYTCTQHKYSHQTCFRLQTQIHRRKGLAIAASRTKTQLTEVGPFVHQ